MKIIFLIALMFIDTKIWFIFLAYEVVWFYEAMNIRNKILSALEKQNENT